MRETLSYWVDRCLGAYIVPDRLRAAGVDVRTYGEVFADDPEVPDTEWITEITKRGWVIVTKDEAIARSAAELAVLRRAKARYVCLAAKGMTGVEQAECLLRHWRTIEGIVAARKPPVIVKVTRTNVMWHDGRGWRDVKLKPARRRRG